MKKLILALLLCAGSALAQTPDTNNDVRVTWNVAMLLSTNQYVSALFVYKQETNGMANAPAMIDWFRGYARSAAADLCAGWGTRKTQAEQSKADFDRLRSWWAVASEAQRSNLVFTLPSPPSQ